MGEHDIDRRRVDVAHTVGCPDVGCGYPERYPGVRGYREAGQRFVVVGVCKYDVEEDLRFADEDGCRRAVGGVEGVVGPVLTAHEEPLHLKVGVVGDRDALYERLSGVVVLIPLERRDGVVGGRVPELREVEPLLVYEDRVVGLDIADRRAAGPCISGTEGKEAEGEEDDRTSSADPFWCHNIPCAEFANIGWCGSGPPAPGVYGCGERGPAVSAGMRRSVLAPCRSGPCDLNSACLNNSSSQVLG
ncbi:MAG: hypothetical protein BWX50_00717 [Euryarchaeota archaeon ADurb.Bin009]|nr:MAG: hypothetical protein BWX50_00717 [Euryarchaeota archaeon ADurb.Bin009]